MTQLTQLQENYCERIVDGMNQTDAYKAAGYSVDSKLQSTVYQAASRLASNSKVVARVAALRAAITAAVTEKRAWDSVRLIDEAEVHMLQAREVKQFAAANGALRLIGQAAGLLKPKPLNADIKITSVTVILHPDGLPPGYQVTECLEPGVIEGISRVLPDADGP